MTQRQDMVIFTRTFDFLAWLLPTVEGFPRAHRHTFTQALVDKALSFRECLEAANHRRGTERIQYLEKASEQLDLVNMYLRLAERMGWLATRRYHHATGLTVEMGRLLGGWIKQSRA